MTEANEHGPHGSDVDGDPAAAGRSGVPGSTPVGSGAAGSGDPAAEQAHPVDPVDPVARELAPVEAAMGEVRGAADGGGAEPRVPGDDEVAALERAHEVLRSTLDRVDRGG